MIWLKPGVFFEFVAVIASDTTMTAPLGLYKPASSPRPIIRIFPGTRLSTHASEAYELCMVSPYDVAAFYDALRGVLALHRARSLGIDCPRAEGVVVEAVVAGRRREGELVVLELEPVDTYYSGLPRPYTRLYGCTVELLIAWSRLKYWASRVRPVDCGAVAGAARQAEAAADCISRAAPGSRLRHEAARILAEAEAYAASTGCAPHP